MGEGISNVCRNDDLSGEYNIFGWIEVLLGHWMMSKTERTRGTGWSEQKYKYFHAGMENTRGGGDRESKFYLYKFQELGSSFSLIPGGWCLAFSTRGALTQFSTIASSSRDRLLLPPPLLSNGWRTCC